jgi:hypothetical protein
MANNDFAHGLMPLQTCLNGGTPKVQYFTKAVGYGTAIFQHDAVNQVADGSIEASATPGTTSYSGVALNYGAPSTATTHAVIVNPDALFEAQEDGSGTFAAADKGLLANLALTAGNAQTKQSKHEISGTSKAVTATLDVRLLELFAVPNNEYGANARVVVMFNKHRMNPSVAGI